MTSLSYPGANPSIINVLAIWYFIDSISDADMRSKTQQTRPKGFIEALKVAIELEAFNRAERQKRGTKYIRPTDTEDERNSDPKKQVAITNEDEQQHMTDLKRPVKELKIMTEENKKKEGTNLKELVDLIKQDRKETSTDKDGYSMRNSPNVNSKLKKKYFICRDERNQSVLKCQISMFFLC